MLLRAPALPASPVAVARVALRSGDVLVSYAGVELNSVDKRPEAIKAKADAKEVTITVWREGGEKPFAHPRFWSVFVLIGDPR